MPETVLLVDPQKIRRNPENPRLIFRQDELKDLQDNIANQGILVPLTVFRDGRQYFLLDGERRWRCALKLGLPRVPVIVQPTPNRMQNIMLMFSIHKTRKDWDPLPTAMKLKDLEDEFKRRNGRKPTEIELAGLASLSRGEVRRLKKLLALPEEYKGELLRELKKPYSEQRLTVDHVLEATKAAEALRKRQITDDEDTESLRRAIVDKFKLGVIRNTVSPRKLARLARAVERNQIPRSVAGRVVSRLIHDQSFSVDDAFSETAEKVDFEQGIVQLVDRLLMRLNEHRDRSYQISQELRSKLVLLVERVRALVGD